MPGSGKAQEITGPLKDAISYSLDVEAGVKDLNRRLAQAVAGGLVLQVRIEDGKPPQIVVDSFLPLHK